MLFMGVFGILLIAYLLFLEPRFERKEMRNLISDYQSDTPVRLKLYKSAFYRTWILGLVVLFAILIAGTPLEKIGFRPITFTAFTHLPFLLKLALGIFLIWYFTYFYLFATIGARIFSRFKPYLLSKMKPVENVTPRTKQEYIWWIANALSSAIEEFIFRGFIFYYFLLLLPQTPLRIIGIISILLESIRYFPRYAAMKYVATNGLVFTLAFLLFNSVFAAMIVHVIYDLRTLAVPFHWLRKKERVAQTVTIQNHS